MAAVVALVVTTTVSAAGAQSYGGRSKGGRSTTGYGKGRSRVFYGPGDIVIANRTAAPIQVWKQEAPLADVAPGKEVVVKKVAGGPQRLLATMADESRVWEVEVFIGPEDHPRWDVEESETKAGVVLRNYTKDVLLLTLESRPPLRAPSGSSAIYYVDSATGKPLRATLESASGRMKYPNRFLEFEEPKLLEWKVGTAPKP